MRTITGRNGGRYYCAPGGPYPSVTTVIGKMLPKDALEKWRDEVGHDVADDIARRAADRGTFMHLMHEAAMDMRGDPDVLFKAYEAAKVAAGGKIGPDEITRGYKLFCNFYATDFYDGIDSVVCQEEAVWSPLGGGFAGRVDLLVRATDGTIKLVDFKSSKGPKQRSWIVGYELQAAAYCAALRDVKGIFPDRAEIWISAETGGVQVFDMDRPLIVSRLREFHALVVAYHKRYENEHSNG